MRDKLHTEPVKLLLTEAYKRKLLNIYLRTGTPPAVLARAFVNKCIDDLEAGVSIQTGSNTGRDSKSLGDKLHGIRTEA
jgi:hypothetical protein